MAIGYAIKNIFTETAKPPADINTPRPDPKIKIGPNSADANAGSDAALATDQAVASSPSQLSPPEAVSLVPEGPVTGTNDPLDFSGTTSGEARAPVPGIDDVNVGTNFSNTDVQMGAAIAIDHGNKFVPWFYGKGAQIVGNVIKGYGIYTKNLGIENAGGQLIKFGEYITPSDHVTQ